MATDAHNSLSPSTSSSVTLGQKRFTHEDEPLSCQAGGLIFLISRQKAGGENGLAVESRFIAICERTIWSHQAQFKCLTTYWSKPTYIEFLDMYKMASRGE